ncbi:MAG: PorV/PorQ family protein [bacterium]|nr:PorV/PorQ family protein [bacterium]
MYKVMKVLVSLGVILALTGGVGEAVKKGSSGAQVLKLSVGARAMAMGETFCGLADDTNAIYYNPAGLAQLNEKQLIVMHSDWLEGINYEFLGYAQPVDKNKTWGMSLGYLNSGDMEKLDTNGITEGNFEAKDMVFSLAYGLNLSKNTLLGASIKTISLKIDNEDANSFALDVGFLSKTPIENLSIGGALQNLGTKVKFINEGDSLPLNLKLGAAYQTIDNRCILLLDINKPVDNKLRLSLGTEYCLVPILAIRAGYNSGIDEGSGMTFGIGYKFHNLQLDYAYVPYEDLGKTNRYCLLIKF